MNVLLHLLRRLPVALALLLVCTSMSAGAAEPASKDEALAALYSTDPMARVDGVDGLARLGSMSDADLVLDALHDADANVRAHAEGAMWQLWSRSGDQELDSLLRTGTEHMNEGQMGQAVDIFTRITERRPDFAEAWNKRATAYFLMGDYDQSSKDCDEVLKLNPHHFGALSGYGLIYLKRGDLERALDYFQQALEINPNMEGVEQSIEAIRYKLGKDGKQDT